MPRSGPTCDERPWFAITATGHPAVIPLGPWAYRGDPRYAREAAGAGRVWDDIDLALSRRVASCRLMIYCRDEPTGIDQVVRAYAAVRGVSCLPVAQMRDQWGDDAPFRRDLDMVNRSHAVLWFGEEQNDGDPARIAQLLGIKVRIVCRIADEG